MRLRTCIICGEHPPGEYGFCEPCIELFRSGKAPTPYQIYERMIADEQLKPLCSKEMGKALRFIKGYSGGTAFKSAATVQSVIDLANASPALKLLLVDHTAAWREEYAAGHLHYEV